jgi:hypothetical protein
MSNPVLSGTSLRLYASLYRSNSALLRCLITGLEGVTVPQVFSRAADFGLGDAPAKIKDKNGIIIRALGVTRVSP